MKRDRKDEILDHARRVFAQHGFRKTTIEDIGKECGLTKNALYHYFRSKEEVFGEVVRAESTRFVARIRQALLEVEEPREKVRTFVLTRFAVLQEVLVLNRISAQTARELVPLAEQARQEFFQEEITLLEEILIEGRKKRVFKVKHTRLVALSMISAFKGIEEQFLLVEDAPAVKKGLEELLRMLFEGLNQK